MVNVQSSDVIDPRDTRQSEESVVWVEISRLIPSPFNVRENLN